MATPNPRNSIATQTQRVVPSQPIDQPADQRAAERIADQDGEDPHPLGPPHVGYGRRPARPRRLVRLRLLQPLVERCQPRIFGKTSGPARARFPPCRSSCASRAPQSGTAQGVGHAGERARQGAVPLGSGRRQVNSAAAVQQCQRLGTHGRRELTGALPSTGRAFSIEHPQPQWLGRGTGSLPLRWRQTPSGRR